MYSIRLEISLKRGFSKWDLFLRPTTNLIAIKHVSRPIISTCTLISSSRLSYKISAINYLFCSRKSEGDERGWEGCWDGVVGGSERDCGRHRTIQKKWTLNSEWRRLCKLKLTLRLYSYIVRAWHIFNHKTSELVVLIKIIKTRIECIKNGLNKLEYNVCTYLRK